MAKAIIDDVAKRAGVSIKTVSRVMNREPNVKEATRDKVLKAAAALKYQPNQSARGLAGNRAYALAILYDNPSPAYITNVQRGVLEVSSEAGYTMVLQPFVFNSDDLLQVIDTFLVKSRVDGLILTPPLSDHQKLLMHLRSKGVPHVSMSPLHDSEGLVVKQDDQAAARDMTRYLINKGHQKIAFVKGHPAHGAGTHRLDGYFDAMRSAGLQVADDWVVQGYFDFESGVDAGKEILKAKDRPTAIFAANDDMAAGVVHAMRQAGLEVPKDISVTGFDDVPLSWQMWPPLTTVRQPIRVMAHRATELLLYAMKNGTVDQIEEVPYELRYRESVRKIN